MFFFGDCLNFILFGKGFWREEVGLFLGRVMGVVLSLGFFFWGVFGFSLILRIFYFFICRRRVCVFL